jgi:hypothetical protein
MPTKKSIKTPETLWELFEEYKQHIAINPRVKNHITPRGEVVEEKLRVPLTWVGFEAFLHFKKIVTQLTHYEQNLNGSYTEYLPIIARIKAIIQADQIEGGMVGQYNSNLTARLNGLVDKSENKQTNVIDVKIDGEDES